MALLPPGLADKLLSLQMFLTLMVRTYLIKYRCYKDIEQFEILVFFNNDVVAHI